MLIKYGAQCTYLSYWFAQYYKFFNSIHPVCFDSVSLSINYFTEHFNAIFYDCSTGTASALLMRNNET